MTVRRMVTDSVPLGVGIFITSPWTNHGVEFRHSMYNILYLKENRSHVSNETKVYIPFPWEYKSAGIII